MGRDATVASEPVLQASGPSYEVLQVFSADWLWRRWPPGFGMTTRDKAGHGAMTSSHLRLRLPCS